MPVHQPLTEIALTAALVGLVHSLAPGHWLPVVLMTKSRKWRLKHGLLGALVAASGHVVISVLLGSVGLVIGAEIFTNYEHQIESYAGLGVAVFGLAFAAYSFFRHSSCHGHTHHGPDPRDHRGPYLFLFMLGFSPCVAVLPVFVAAASGGVFSVAITMGCFALGVLSAFSGAVFLVTHGFKMDWPVLEHYGDVITGLCVMALGLFLFLVPI